MPQLPTGTVTLLFTDIEGSTRLLHELGDRYAEALAEHRATLREAFSRRCGVEVDTQGDAFFYAFTSAEEAVEAAGEAQRALADGPVRVRIGIHTGEPAVTDEGYVGIDVHRAARVMAAGHGGQVLLTRATRELLDEDLALEDLGEHRLKDLPEALWLYQLAGEGEFPPLRSLNNTNLPAFPSPLVGRERELAELFALVQDDARLVTLTGPGGTGKTRLALELGAELAADFPNGVFFVDLAPVADPGLVASAIARPLAVRERADEPLAETLAAELAERRLLLLLDNCEHLLEAAPLVSKLLARARELRVVATSREPLRLAGEREYPLQTLAEPDAVALFAERAASVQPAFRLEGQEETVAAVCRRLDGLPLAVELAAARVRLLAPHALLERLEQRLPLLTGGRRDLPERQRTLRAAIEWSHDLLTEEERRVFSCLGVFAGGWTLEAAEAVARADLDTLASLQEKSLVRADGERFSMLETIREYAHDRLRESRERHAIEERHADFFADLVERGEAGLSGPAQAESLAAIDADYDNIRAALDRSAEAGYPAGLRIAGHLAYYWYVRGHTREALSALERLAPAGEETPPALRARLLDGLALFASLRGSKEPALELSREGLALARASDDAAALGHSLVIRQMVSVFANDPAAYEATAREAVDLARTSGDTLTLAASLSNLCDFELVQGRYEEAESLGEESLALFQSLGDAFDTAGVLANLAEAAIGRGDLQTARARLVAAAVAAREAQSYERYLWVLRVLIALAYASGAPERAARLVGASEALLAEHEIALVEFEAARARREQTLAELRAALGDDAFERAYAEGAALTPDEALDLGLTSGA